VLVKANRLIALMLGAVLPHLAIASPPFYDESFEGSTPAGNGVHFFWSGGAWSKVVSGFPKSGVRSMRFRHEPWPDASSEEQFTFTAAHREVWIRYWLRVPANFEHAHPPNLPTNNKLFALWMDNYSQNGFGPTVVWEYWHDGQNGSELSVHYSEGNLTPAGPHHQYQPFISTPADRGRWMQIVLHVRAATRNGAGASNNDGLIETYRRWDGESAYARLHQVVDVNIAPPMSGPFGWARGYFMGWSNPGFVEETDFYIDDVEISDSMDLSASGIFAHGFE
jgi:hypothetical protein